MTCKCLPPREPQLEGRIPFRCRWFGHPWMFVRSGCWMAIKCERCQESGGSFRTGIECFDKSSALKVEIEADTSQAMKALAQMSDELTAIQRKTEAVSKSIKRVRRQR